MNHRPPQPDHPGRLDWSIDLDVHQLPREVLLAEATNLATNPHLRGRQAVLHVGASDPYDAADYQVPLLLSHALARGVSLTIAGTQHGVAAWWRAIRPKVEVRSGRRLSVVR